MYYIYLIVNKVNGKTYIGQRKSSKEWYEDKYMGSGKYLYNAKQKYGIENFEKFLIQYCYSKEETDKAERFWIAEYRKRGKAEYNIADGGQGGNLGEEVNKKKSEKLKGRTPWIKGKHHSEETKRKIGKKSKGRLHSEETKKKLSEAARNMTEETKKKISEAKKGRQSPMKGKHRSEEFRIKLSESNKGKKLSEETKKKISKSNKGHLAWNKGKHHTEEAKRKISEAGKGKHFSEDHKRKIGESNRGKRKGKHWYNNGEINVIAKECPEGFVKGRLRVYH